MKIKHAAVKEGDRIVLPATADDGDSCENPRERCEVCGVESDRSTMIVRICAEDIGDPNDDGLRELAVDSYEEYETW